MQMGRIGCLETVIAGAGFSACESRLQESTPYYAESDVIYSAQTEDVSIESLVYFCSSVFWRASVVDWSSGGRKYERISLGEPYQEELRRYLVGDSVFPQHVAVAVILSGLAQPVLAFNFPVSVRTELGYTHRLHVPGITFLLMIGKALPNPLDICILRSSVHPIFESKIGDERVQSEILRRMGKVAPPWGEFPLTEGSSKRENLADVPK
jgi:hypothetical protein